jgi:hypothetical protein
MEKEVKKQNNNVFNALCRELPSWVDSEKYLKAVIKNNPLQTIFK